MNQDSTHKPEEENLTEVAQDEKELGELESEREIRNGYDELGNQLGILIVIK